MNVFEDNEEIPFVVFELFSSDVSDSTPRLGGSPTYRINGFLSESPSCTVYHAG